MQCHTLPLCVVVCNATLYHSVWMMCMQCHTLPLCVDDVYAMPHSTTLCGGMQCHTLPLCVDDVYAMPHSTTLCGACNATLYHSLWMMCMQYHTLPLCVDDVPDTEGLSHGVSPVQRLLVLLVWSQDTVVVVDHQLERGREGGGEMDNLIHIEVAQHSASESTNTTSTHPAVTIMLSHENTRMLYQPSGALLTALSRASPYTRSCALPY